MDDRRLPLSETRSIVAFRGGGFEQRPHVMMSGLGFVGLIALWQMALSLNLVSPVFLPSPLSIVKALWGITLSGELWKHVSASLGRIGGGWAIGTFLGLLSGIGIGLSERARAIAMPLVSALYPIPKIALLPLLILWFGIGEAPKLITIASGVFFPTIIATLSGLDSAPRSLIRMAQSFNVPVRAIVWKVMLPAALPGILSGARISVATALILVVAAEMIGAQFGVGAFLLTAGNLMQSDELLAGVVILSLMGILFGAVVTAIESRLLHWR